jgi:hypothetical protein
MDRAKFPSERDLRYRLSAILTARVIPLEARTTRALSQVGERIEDWRLCSASMVGLRISYLRR